MTDLQHTIDLIHKHSPRQPFCFEPALAVPGVTYHIAKVGVERGDMLLYAPNDDKRRLSNIPKEVQKAVVLAVKKRMELLKPKCV